MSVSIESAIRLAVLGNPETFGLCLPDVNPLLLFSLNQMAGQEPDDQFGLQACVDLCQLTLHTKVIELLSGMRSSPASTGQVPAPAPAAAPPSPAQDSSSGKAAQPDPASGVKISPKQLRYLGFLHRQLNEVPDYKEIGTLTQVQATMRIKDLEKKLGR